MSTYTAAEQHMAERCKPNPEKPWRVTWGFGVFEDFASEAEAVKEFESIPVSSMPEPPFRTDTSEETSCTS